MSIQLRNVAILLGFVVAPPLAAQRSARSADSAAVRAAQSIYQEVAVALAQRLLMRHDTTVHCMPDSLDVRASMYRDRRQRIRRLDTESGTEDYLERVAIYFDTLGRARFALAERGAVNRTQQEERVYYDQNGRVVRRAVHQTHGPGHPFGTLTAPLRLATWIDDLCG